MGGLLTLASFVARFPRIDTVNTTGAQNQNNSTIQGTVIAIYEIGCTCCSLCVLCRATRLKGRTRTGMIGALTCLYVGERFGRRKTIFFGSIIMTIGAALQCTAYSLAQLIGQSRRLYVGNAHR